MIHIVAKPLTLLPSYLSCCSCPNQFGRETFLYILEAQILTFIFKRTLIRVWPGTCSRLVLWWLVDDVLLVTVIEILHKSLIFIKSYLRSVLCKTSSCRIYFSRFRHSRCGITFRNNTLYSLFGSSLLVYHDCQGAFTSIYVVLRHAISFKAHVTQEAPFSWTFDRGSLHLNRLFVRHSKEFSQFLPLYRCIYYREILASFWRRWTRVLSYDICS